MADRFAFDNRVSNIYNQQRRHPVEVSQKIGAAIAAQAGTGGRVLEIGVGTGRIAWPVVDAGCEVFGFDLSPNMLDEVYAEREQTPDDRLHLLQLDMHHFGFADNVFDATLAVHVLHLAKDWQQVLREIARVLKPGAVFIQGDDWMDPDSVIGALRNELRAHVMRIAPQMRPPAAGISKQDYLAQLGGTDVTEVVAAEWTGAMSPNDRLRDYENRIDAESWILPSPLFETCLAHLREFAAATWDDLDAPQPITRRFILKTTRGDW